MKYFTLAALAAAVLLSGCVAYPVDRNHDGDHRREYRDRDRDGRNDWYRDRDRDHYHNGRSD